MTTDTTAAPTEHLTPVDEHCRHWPANGLDRCGKRAIVIVWGKLSHPEELGPRCIDHLPKWLSLHQIDQYAVFDLRRIYRQEQL